MAANTGKLAGKVLFITGASRGIGRAIALKAAKDGASIVVAAKSKDPHPKLPGTIYTVAEEVEKAGGKCLPCVVDVRYEDQVTQAVDQTIRAFGRLDILVNNASAISLTNTSSTTMKTFDLMNSINARGTYLCSRACLPHLEKAGPGSHILNLSPPLNLNPKWFENHVAYTMAKYGMSMCVLGMSPELKDRGIAVNALWPRTAIYTAAMEMLGGGKAVEKQCRKVDIMADAAYVVFSQPPSFTGNFLIDEDLLRDKAALTNFDQYACVPGQTELILDFFLDNEPAKMGVKTDSGAASGKLATVEHTFQEMQKLLSVEAVKMVGASFAFNLTDPEPGTWFLDLKQGNGAAGPLDAAKLKDMDVQMTTSSDDFVRMFSGQLSPTQAFMGGKLKMKGNVMMAMRLETLMNNTVKPKM